MKKYEVVAYDAADIGALKFMSRDEVVSVLNDIERGYLPKDYVVEAEDGMEYTESQYYATRVHVAIRMAQEMLRWLPMED